MMETNNNNEWNHLRLLIHKSLEGALDLEERKALSDILLESSEARRYYIDYMAIHSGLFSISNDILGKDSEQEACNFTEELFRLAEYEKIAPAIEIPEEKPKRELIQKVVCLPREKRKVSKFSIFTLVTSAAAILFVVLFIRFVPDKQSAMEVATLVGQMNAQWAKSNLTLNEGDRLWTKGGPLELKKGMVQLQYDDGVEVVIEGPSIFEIEQSRILLEYGRLYSRVLKSGLGFTVKTPTAQFVDMGTEFGVQADINGSAELHVIKGKVQLFAGANGSKSGQMVAEDNAVRFDAYESKVRTIPVKQEAFVRQFDSSTKTVWRGQDSINLADIVNGGNGFHAGLPSGAISPETGDLIPLRNCYENPRFDLNRAYIKPVKSSPYIDCIIVPGRMGGNTPLTTAGHVCQDLPPTLGSLVFDVQTQSYRVSAPLVLNGITYDTYQRPAILIHSSSGLTFDLDAIRTNLPDFGLRSFKALCGNNETAIDPEHPEFDTEMRVFLDGVEVFHRQFPHARNAAIPIEIDLNQKSCRFLTLLVTNGNGDNNGDWFVFGEPRLQLYEK